MALLYYKYGGWRTERLLQEIERPPITESAGT